VDHNPDLPPDSRRRQDGRVMQQQRFLERDLVLGERTVHAYDTGPTGRADELVVFWHGGTPNIGAPPEPFFPVSEPLGIRWIGADRPGYGGSTADPATSLASVADDAARVADLFGVGTFAALGHSGGGPRALVCAALLPDRVRAAVSVSSPAPWPADGLDWFAGMAAGPQRELAAAAEGRAALQAVLAADEFDPSSFLPADYAALEGSWSWFNGIVEAAGRNGEEGFLLDDLAAMTDWGQDLARITVPVLVAHGAADAMVPASHGVWLAEHVPAAELLLVPGAGHISVLEQGERILGRLRALAAR
jgi:pimeloyl-ACP methyl ester carboxylesterase